MAVIHEIVFDCDNPGELAAFWAELLDGYSVRHRDEDDIAQMIALDLNAQTETTVMVDGPGPSICFQNVDGQRCDNNRVHFDVEVSDRASETQRLTEAGASVERVLPTYTVMRDPEGNQFCLVDAHDVANRVAA
ncbi:VOC family protein [Devosia sp. PTR5]|uniref:VOC family protein n=1 Tax=Devosia oryzisoli TaxID=2774138 RepID=A0A927IRP9_9HYPH|nr:VOC family protein [Devosia oryzisoli]MBD8063933.1 VOC family protein [Devosia oryzisoli]